MNRTVVHVAHITTVKDNPITNALRNLDRDVIEVDYFNYLFGRERHNSHHFTKRLTEIVASEKPEFVFMQVQSPGIITIPGMHDLTKLAPVVIWTGDVRENIDFQMELASAGALCLFCNEDDVDKMRQAGFPSDYLQAGFHTGMHNPFHRVDHKLGKVVFVGSHYPNTSPLSNERLELCTALSEHLGDDFHVYGLGWENTPVRSQGIAEIPTLTQLYSGYDIAINHSNFLRRRYSSDRIFAILGSGTFCMTHRYPGIELEFEEFAHLCAYDSIPDCITKIEYWLQPSKANERMNIAKQGCTYAHEFCNWEERMRDVFRLVKKYYGESDNGEHPIFSLN
jgi:hypothetical protein